MGRDRQVRLPFAALLAHVSGTRVEQARRLGIQHRQLYRYLDYDVPINSADKLAIALGFHPIEIWGTEYQHALTEVDDRIEHARLRHNDRQRVRNHFPKSGWEELERSYRQWSHQREYWYYSAIDRQTEMSAG